MSERAMDDWLTALCERLGVPIDDVDVPVVLDVAAETAHQVERPAAPVTTFVVGYAAALRGGGAQAVASAAGAATDLAHTWPGGEAPTPVTPVVD